MADDKPIPSRRRDVGVSSIAGDAGPDAPVDTTSAAPAEDAVQPAAPVAPAPGPDTHVLMQAPDNCAPFHVDGVPYEVDQAGHVLVLGEHASRILPFGFKAI